MKVDHTTSTDENGDTHNEHTIMLRKVADDEPTPIPEQEPAKSKPEQNYEQAQTLDQRPKQAPTRTPTQEQPTQAQDISQLGVDSLSVIG